MYLYLLNTNLMYIHICKKPINLYNYFKFAWLITLTSCSKYVISLCSIVLRHKTRVHLYKKLVLPIIEYSPIPTHASLLPQVKKKIRSTTSEILSLPRILVKTSFKKKGKVKKIRQPPPRNPSQDERISMSIMKSTPLYFPGNLPLLWD